MLADSYHVPKRHLAWMARGTKWHFQHKHIIMCADLSVRPLLAQPVGQGAGTGAPLPVWPQLCLPAGTSSQICTHITRINTICHFNNCTNTGRSCVRVMNHLAAAATLPTLCLLSDVKLQPGERLTPWTHSWTQPGITSDTRTLVTQTGIQAQLSRL